MIPYEREKYRVSSLEELQQIMAREIELYGLDTNLNFLDVSELTDLSGLMAINPLRYFNGDISQWDVSNVTNMDRTFQNSYFNGDISQWNTSKVQTMAYIFEGSQFRGDVSTWDVSNVIQMHGAFANTSFDSDISQWNVSKVRTMQSMFHNSLFKQDLSSWNIDPEVNWYGAFNKFHASLPGLACYLAQGSSIIIPEDYPFISELRQTKAIVNSLGTSPLQGAISFWNQHVRQYPLLSLTEEVFDFN